MTNETYLPVHQVAERYCTSTASIWRWVRLNKFPRPVKLSPGCTRWRSSDIDAWEAECVECAQ